MSVKEEENKEINENNKQEDKEVEEDNEKKINQNEAENGNEKGNEGEEGKENDQQNEEGGGNENEEGNENNGDGDNNDDSEKKQNIEKDFYGNKEIIITDESYYMKNTRGEKFQITKEELEDISCLKQLKDKNKKRKKEEKQEEKQDENGDEKKEDNSQGQKGKNETKTDQEDQLRRILYRELNQVKKTTELKEKLEQKQKRIEDFKNTKKNNIGLIISARSKDHNDVYQRKLLCNEMLTSHENKLYFKKKQRERNYDTLIANEKDEERRKKLLFKKYELERQIEDYEKKEKNNLKKINDLFELEKNENKITSPQETEENKTSKELMQKKFDTLEEKFQIEKYRRETALLRSIDRRQNKINLLIEQNEEKEEKTKKALQKAKEDREKKIAERNLLFNEVMERIKTNNKALEDKRRRKLLDTIEKKNLRTFVIKKEKEKMIEGKKKFNIMKNRQSEDVKLKLEKIINSDSSVSGEKKIEMINNLINNV